MGKSFAREVLATLRRHGSHVTKPHPFEFYLKIPSKRNATLAAQKISQSGFTSAVTRSEKKWLIVAGKLLIPATANLADHTRFFQEMADAVGVDFDGWEAEIVEK